MAEKIKEQTKKYKPHGDYSAKTEKVEYMLMVEDGSFVGSDQPAEIAEEIIHCAATLEQEAGPCADFDLHVTTAHGGEYYYRLIDFWPVTDVE